MNQPKGQNESLNVFEELLEPCSTEPLTGFYRDGCCNTGENDHGSHTVCVRLTDDFLDFSASRGNDLKTPMPAFNFPGLSDGQRWCLCANRWLEAHNAGKAPRVFLKSTHLRALEVIPMDVIRSYAIDLN